MSLFDKLKRLRDEVNCLFHKGLNENAVFVQLRTNEQFADASYEQVQAFYSSLQEKLNAEARDMRRIAEHEEQIAEQLQIIEYLYQMEENQRQIAKYERELDRKQRMIPEIEAEIEFMVKYKQNSNKFLIYADDFFARLFDVKYFWQERFFITVTTGSIHVIKIQDLFQDITKSFTVWKVGTLHGIYALKFPFVLFHEYDSIKSITYLRLVTFNFESESLEVVQSFEFNADCHVLINASDSSKFLLQKGNDIVKYRLVGDKIQISEKLAMVPNFNIKSGSYFDKQLCNLQFGLSRNNQFENRQLTQIKMMLYDLEENEHSTQDLDSTPENLVCLTTNEPNFSWIHDTVFVAVRFSLTRNYGIIFANPQVPNWKVIEFATDLQIDHIQSFVDGTLMVYSEEEEQSKKKIYKLQMRKPNFLRNMAWIAIIKLFKEAKIKNLYEEARKYLPLNSEIQPFVFTED